MTAAEAVAGIESGSRIYLHGMAAGPSFLVNELCSRRDLENVEIVSLHTEGPAPYVEPGNEGRFRINALFIGPNIRAAINEGLIRTCRGRTGTA